MLASLILAIATQCGPAGCALPPPAPTVYVLADATGQRWTSPDPAWLRGWVARRNATVAAPVYAPPAFFPAFGGGCANGRCPAGAHSARCLYCGRVFMATTNPSLCPYCHRVNP